MPPEATRGAITAEAREDYDKTFQIDGTEQRYVPLTVGDVELRAVQIVSHGGSDTADGISAILYETDKSLSSGEAYAVSTPHQEYGELLFAGYNEEESGVLRADFENPNPDVAKINGVDMHAFQIEYFDGDAIGDIAVGVTDPRPSDLPALVISANDPLWFEHGADKFEVTLAAVQFEESSPVVWFDRA